MTVYVDVLFAINFTMDFLSLFITSMILHKKIHKIGILIGASIGGVYSIFEILVQVNFIISAVLCVVVSFLMCFVAFKVRSVKRFTLMYVMFWGVSASLGGVMSLLYSVFNKILYSFIISQSYDNAYNGARFFIISALAIMAAIIFGKLYSNKKDIKEVDVKIKINDENYKILGLCDSGNLLTEPITGKSVILICSNSKIGKIIDSFPELRKRYIPYNSVEEKGIIKGILPTQILINDSEVSAILATVKKKDFAGYQALVPTCLL